MSLVAAEKFPEQTPVFLRQAHILAMIPFSKATLWRRVAEGTFPAPIKLSPRVTAWRTTDVHEWMDAQ